MLTQKAPDDPVITIQIISPETQASFNKLAVENIAKAMNIDVHFCTATLPMV